MREPHSRGHADALVEQNSTGKEIDRFLHRQIVTATKRLRTLPTGYFWGACAAVGIGVGIWLAPPSPEFGTLKWVQARTELCDRIRNTWTDRSGDLRVVCEVGSKNLGTYHQFHNGRAVPWSGGPTGH